MYLGSPARTICRMAALSDGMGKADGGHEPSKAAGGHEPSKAAGDDGGLGVVRIKPLGAGGGGGEAARSRPRATAAPPPPSVRYTARSVTIDGRRFDYPRHVIGPEMDQRALYDAFMPQRVAAFLDGVNVNVMAYGQTGSGKTHTMFGPPGMMARARRRARSARPSPTTTGSSRAGCSRSSARRARATARAPC